MMQFRDLGAQYQALKNDIDQGIQEVIKDSQFILGRPVGELEDQLKAFVGTKHCVTCANGTDALQLVLMAWGIGPGDAVFTSDFTYFASAGCASVVGATPVLVDIDADTFNISPIDLEKKIEQVIREGKLSPKVIIPVDLFGLPADHDAIRTIARKYSLRVLEDGAQGFGGHIRGKKACSFGEAAITSFFPAKPLGCYGDGGAIFTDDSALDVLLRSLRAQGRSPEDKYDNRLIGLNSRLDTMQAAILLPKLAALQKYELASVNRVADAYTAALKDAVKTPVVPEGYYSSWAQYTIMLEDQQTRDGLQKHLKASGIPTMIYYPRGLHQQTAYQGMKLKDEDYPNTVRAVQCVLSLPMHPYMPEEDVSRVAEAVKAFVSVPGRAQSETVAKF